jgi:hypothetical protein
MHVSNITTTHSNLFPPSGAPKVTVPTYLPLSTPLSISIRNRIQPLVVVVLILILGSGKSRRPLQPRLPLPTVTPSNTALLSAFAFSLPTVSPHQKPSPLERKSALEDKRILSFSGPSGALLAPYLFRTSVIQTARVLAALAGCVCVCGQGNGRTSIITVLYPSHQGYRSP